MTTQPICSRCNGPMRVVTIHHKNGHISHNPLCPTCITSKPKITDEPATQPKLTLVRTERRTA